MSRYRTTQIQASTEQPFRFDLDEWWHAEPRRVALWVQFGRDGSFHVGTQPDDLALVDPARPIRLTPTMVTKPWGRELWFTGIEARGVSAVSVDGRELPLPWVLAAAPRDLLGGRLPVLLKLLDPSPEAVTGDLYFELHATKHEVYVVTHIDETAWPSGRGEVRLGMDQSQRRRFQSDDQFRAGFLERVLAYRDVRNRIDAGESVDVEHERRLRDAMDSFTAKLTVAPGDVVSIPTFVPHALQHGIRAIEFQSQNYERQIISFAQRVHTQPHWDSERAIAHMRLDEPDTVDDILIDADGVRLTRIAQFDDFDAFRLHLTSGSACTLPRLAHTVAMGVSGTTRLNQETIQAHDAVLLAHDASGHACNESRTDSAIVFAGPKEVS